MIPRSSTLSSLSAPEGTNSAQGYARLEEKAQNLPVVRREGCPWRGELGSGTALQPDPRDSCSATGNSTETGGGLTVQGYRAPKTQGSDYPLSAPGPQL